MSPRSPIQGPSLPHVKWGNALTRLPCSQGSGEGGTVSLVTDTETEARRHLAWSPVPCRRGSGWAQAPAGPPPASLLPLGADGGNGPHLCLPAPRRLPPGRPGQRAQVSHSRFLCLFPFSPPWIQRERHSPGAHGEAGRVAFWLWSGQAGSDATSHPMSLGRLGPLGVSTGTFPTAPSHDPCAHPAGYAPGLPCWGPSGVQRLR